MLAKVTLNYIKKSLKMINKKNLKICMIIDAWYPITGGAQVHILELAKILIKKYHCQIDLFARNLKDERGQCHKKKESFFQNRLNVYRIGPAFDFFNLWGRLYFLFVPIVAMMKMNQKRNYDLIHAHAYLGAIPAKIISIILKKPIIYTVHGSNLLDLKDQSLPGQIEKWLLTGIHYDQEISVSSNFLIHPNINKKIAIIPNGIDIKKFDQVKKKLSQKQFKVIFVGRFDKIKGLDYLIQAIKILKKHHLQLIQKKKLQVHLIGYGYEEKKLKKIVLQHQLTKFIHFRGKIVGQKLIQEYKGADLFILPSLAEGQPITLLEAFAARLPVIVTRVGDNTRFVKNNQNGWIVPKKNSRALVNKILEVLKSSNLKKMGQQNYQMAKNNYSWQQCGQKTYRLYQKVLNEKN